MKSETSITRSLNFGLVAIAALVLSIGLASGNLSDARAQSDDAAADAATNQPDQNADPNEAADQQMQDAVDSAQEALDSATEARDRLESEGASQDQIDAANAAIAQARAEKQATDAAAAQRADEAAGH